MPLSTVVLQNLQFPTQQEFKLCTDLFYRCDLSRERWEDRIVFDDCRWDFAVDGGMISEERRIPFLSDNREAPRAEDSIRYDANAGCIIIPAGKTVDLSCYFNMLPARKWFELTYVEAVDLCLDIEGEAFIDLLSYDLPAFESPAQVEAFAQRRRAGQKETSLQADALCSANCSQDERASLTIPVGHPNVTLVGVAITARSETKLYGGAWLGSVKSDYVRNIDLYLATTTFRREDYIAKNIGIIKAALKDDVELAKHLRMIVVDNGRTLDPGEFEDDNIRIAPNVNEGGSGGFARGMIEALREDKKPTHMLVIDDDVLILPESIRRTRALLQVLKPHYHDHFISGAMLRLETMDVQHEDVGIINKEGGFQSKKGPHALTTIVDCAYNDTPWPTYDFEYASWWYCCIPMKFVTEHSLPAPFFIRGDDVDFSIRNNANILSMNGICVWHKGFSQKFSASIEYYQVIRNSFILQDFHPQCAEIDFFNHFRIILTQLLNKLSYDYADLMLDAMEDYLKGPSILEQADGASILAEKATKNEEHSALSEIWNGNVDFAALFGTSKASSPLSRVRRKLVTISFNGQAHAQAMLDDAIGFAAYDFEYAHEPLFFKKRILSINPLDASAAIHERDHERFIEIQNRWQRLLERYQNEHEQIARAYKNAYPHLTSLAFWEQHLGI